MALGIVPSDSDLAAKVFADLKAAQIEVDTLTQAVKGLTILMTSLLLKSSLSKRRLNTYKNKVEDGVNEVRVRELYLERTTRANDDYKK
jgi:hypothetical protein